MKFPKAYSILSSPLVRSMIRPIQRITGDGSKEADSGKDEPPEEVDAGSGDAERGDGDDPPEEQSSKLIETQVYPKYTDKEEKELPGEYVGVPEGVSHTAISLPAPGCNPRKRRKKTNMIFDDDEVILRENRRYLTVGGVDREVPDELAKYYRHRYRLFSRFDEGCCLDHEGWYSVTPEAIAADIAERCRCGVVVDAFCGVGGNTIQFALTCEHVIAIDNSEIRLACALRNARIYGVQDKITFIHGDFLEWAKAYADALQRGDPLEYEVEVIFLSPPWGGVDYGTRFGDTYPLDALQPVSGQDLFKLVRAITPDIAFYLPRNVDLADLSDLPSLYPYEEHRASTGYETVEVEQMYIKSALKALCVYYGSLADPATNRAL